MTELRASPSGEEKRNSTESGAPALRYAAAAPPTGKVRDAIGAVFRQAAAILGQAVQNRGFLACTILLAVFAAGFQILTRGYTFKPEAVPLKKPLNQLSQQRLGQYKLIKPMEIQPDILNTLGTDQYVQWIMQDLDQPDGRPGRPISLFVTYYTGLPDQVPHVPEACYVGGGHEVVAQTTDEITVPSPGEQIVVPLQIVEFRKESFVGRGSRIVVYTFHANGKFRQDRTAVRLAIGSLTDRFAYFSKIEVGMELEPERFPKDKAVEAIKRFLRVAIPVLLEDHWPDWDAVTKGPTTRPAATQGS